MHRQHHQLARRASRAQLDYMRANGGRGSQLGVLPVLGIAKGVAALAQAVPAIKSLTGGKPSKSETVWKAYKPQAGKQLGRNYDAHEFAEVVKGGFDTNRNIYGIDRETLLAQTAGAMVGAIKTGKVPSTVSAPEMFVQVIKPFLASTGKVNMGRFDGHATMPHLWTDIADRYLNNLPITRADIPGISGGPYNVHAPLLFDALGLATTTAAPTAPTTVKTPDPAASIVPTQPVPSALAPILAPLPSFAPTGGALPFAPATASAPEATSAPPDRLPLYLAAGAGAVVLVMLLTQRGRK